MAKRNRETLKNYFRAGKRPTEQHYEDLIDSTLNTLDDGFDGTAQAGLGLTPLSDTGNVLSVYPHAGAPNPAWEMGISKNEELQFKSRKDATSQPVCTFKHPSGRGRGNEVPEMVVEGTIAGIGRKGIYRTGNVPADGKWHDILADDAYLQEEGCRAFEIAAGCGERDKGRYALLIATVMHCFGENARINKTHSHFGIFGNKLCLRWVKVKNRFTCKLQIKTFFAYGGEAMIHYHITNLWDNPAMQE